MADVGLDCHVVEFRQEGVNHLNVGLHAPRVKEFKDGRPFRQNLPVPLCFYQLVFIDHAHEPIKHPVQPRPIDMQLHLKHFFVIFFLIFFNHESG